MRRSMICISLLLALSYSAVHADNTCREVFYRISIDEKISQCQRKLTFMDSKGERLRTSGELALAQMRFYLINKDDLVCRMDQQDIGFNDHEINHFLIKEYKYSSNRNIFASR